MRAAIIGAGRMGRRHIEAVRGAGLALAAIADLSTEALALARADSNLSEQSLYDDAGRMLQETKPECVIIATNAPSHYEYTQQAVQAGARFILCEKPMSVSLAQCDDMIRLCNDHGAALAI